MSTPMKQLNLPFPNSSTQPAQARVGAERNPEEDSMIEERLNTLLAQLRIKFETVALEPDTTLLDRAADLFEETIELIEELQAQLAEKS